MRCGPPEGLLALGCRDVPIEGEAIGAGQPICTLVARGESTAACRESLARGAQAALACLDRAQTPGLVAFPGARRSW